MAIEMSFDEGIKALEMLKQKKEQNAVFRATEKIILLERRQISKNNPAVAQLHIKFPNSDETPIMFREYYEKLFTNFPLDADVHEFREISIKNYVIEIRSTKLMYTWLEYFVSSMIRDYGKTGKGYLIKIGGIWDKYDV